MAIGDRQDGTPNAQCDSATVRNSAARGCDVGFGCGVGGDEVRGIDGDEIEGEGAPVVIGDVEGLARPLDSQTSPVKILKAVNALAIRR
jgi:hypothetical protein